MHFIIQLPKTIECTGFCGGSDGKVSAWNAGDLGSIPGSGRSPGEGNGNPLQYSWASLVAQLAKNLPAMCETWLLSLGWEDPLEKGKAAHSRVLAWRTPWTVSSMESQRVRYDWATFTCRIVMLNVFFTSKMFAVKLYWQIKAQNLKIKVMFTGYCCLLSAQ